MSLKARASVAAVPISVVLLLVVAGIYSEPTVSARAFNALKTPNLTVDEKLGYVRQLDRIDRVRYAGTLSAEERSELWARHLGHWLVPEGRLSTEQSNFIARARTIVADPSSFTDGRLKAVCPLGRQLLGGAFGELVLARLGSRPGDVLFPPTSVGIAKKALNSIGDLLVRPVRASSRYLCTCPWEDPGGWCCPPACDCIRGDTCSNYGLSQCGCLGTYACTGYCASCGTPGPEGDNPQAR